MGSSYGFYCEYQGRRRTIEQAGRLFPESQDHLIAVAARIEAECDATMKFLLAEALAGVESKMGDSDRGSSKGTGSL
jgi:hypothetical protein